MNRPSAWVLIAVNSVPLLGVLVFDWSVFDVVFLYWAENVVIGVVNVLRMLSCRPDSSITDHIASNRAAQKLNSGFGVLFFVLFFSVHYGMFCWGHQQFVIGIFGDGRSLYEVLEDPVLWIALAAIAGSHLFSYFTNFLATGEYRRTHPALLMARPYGRVVVLHISIIIGGFLVQLADSAVAMLVVLIVIKTVIDYRQHGKERSLLQAMPADRRAAG